MSNDTNQGWFQRHKVLTGIACFILFIFIIAPYMDDSDKKSSSVSSLLADSATTSPTKEESDTITAGFNEPINLGTHEVKVLSAEEEQTLSAKYGDPVAATKGTKFVVVELQVTSKSSTDFLYFPDDSMRLLDTESRQFSTYDGTIGAVDNYLNVRSLSPSIPETGVVVYQIPEDVTTFGLLLKNKSSDEVILVNLSNSLTK